MIEIKFKHTKSNFFILIKSRLKKSKYFKNFTAGNLVEYEKRSSKKQKNKLGVEQLAVISAARVCYFFGKFLKYKPLKLDSNLAVLSNFIFLIPNYLNLLTKRKLREPYKKFKSRYQPENLVVFPSLVSLYKLSCKPTKNKTHQIKRYTKLKKKHEKVKGRKKFQKFDDRLGKHLYYNWIYEKKNI